MADENMHIDNLRTLRNAMVEARRKVISEALDPVGGYFLGKVTEVISLQQQIDVIDSALFDEETLAAGTDDDTPDPEEQSFQSDVVSPRDEDRDRPRPRPVVSLGHQNMKNRRRNN
ncbi:MAG: hypothetical protein JWM58_2537 [Rhizobium sp.]|nr:hypothetical protein [Rhizobium sp.]